MDASYLPTADKRSRTAAVVEHAFLLGQRYQANQEELAEVFARDLGQLIAGLEIAITSELNVGANTVEVLQRLAIERQTIPPALSGEHRCQIVDLVFSTPGQVPEQPQRLLEKNEKLGALWTTLIDCLFFEKPGVTAETIDIYKSAFAVWKSLVGEKPIGEIRMASIKLLSNKLRDRESNRGGKLAQKTMGQTLGHLKTLYGLGRKLRVHE